MSCPLCGFSPPSPFYDQWASVCGKCLHYFLNPYLVTDPHVLTQMIELSERRGLHECHTGPLHSRLRYLLILKAETEDPLEDLFEPRD